MASPSMPKITRIMKAIRTIACPFCSERSRALSPSFISGLVLSSVDRIRGDDDLIADCLSNQRRQGLEVVPEGDLEGLVFVSRHSVVAAGGRRIEGHLPCGSVGRSIAAHARVRDEDPSSARRGKRRRTLRDPVVGNRAVGARVAKSHVDRVCLNRRLNVGVVWIVVRRAAWVDEIGGANCSPGAFIRGFLQRDVHVEATPEIDDREGQEQQDRGDDGEFGQTLGPLASKPRGKLFHGFPWTVKCSLYATFKPLPKMPWINGVMSAKFIRIETFTSPKRHALSVGALARVADLTPLGSV